MRTVTIADIKKQARMRADMRNSSFVSDSELLAMINEAYTELYDMLVQAFENYFVSTYEFPVGQPATSYALPADFYKIIGVDFQVSLGKYLTLYPFNEIDRNASLTNGLNIPSGAVRLRYVPAPAVFTLDTDTINGVSGWESLLVTDVAIMMLDAEESNTDRLERRRERTVKRIQEMAQNRDLGMPGTISDVYVSNLNRIFASLRYRLYNDNLELVSTEFTGSAMGSGTYF